jgi:hypothetical protein
MKAYCKKVFFLPFMLLPCIMCTSQVRIEHAEHMKGTLKREEQTLKFIRSFKVLPDAKASSLAMTTDKIMDAICRLPQLNAPTGFDAKVNVAGTTLGLKERKPHFMVYCYLRYLVKDSHTGIVKQSMDGADLYLYINAFGFFDQMGNYWQDCDKAKFPLFFEQPSLLDSMDDYITFKYKGDPIRIVLANDKPLFIPLTRKEFVQFLIARKNFEVKDDQGIIADLQKTIKEAGETLAHPTSYLTAEVKKALVDGVTVQEKQVANFKEEIKKKQAKILRYREYLNAMNPREAAAPTRLDYDKKSDELMGGLEQLVPVGRQEGVMLTKINPDYYNHSPNAPVAQMLTLYYAWPKVGFEQDPDYLQQTTIDIFNQLDYHQLKESMK